MFFVLLLRIQNITEDFYKYAKVKEVAANLNMKDDYEVVDLVFEYWKLKRKVCQVIIITIIVQGIYNAPLPHD